MANPSRTPLACTPCVALLAGAQLDGIKGVTRVGPCPVHGYESVTGRAAPSSGIAPPGGVPAREASEDAKESESARDKWCATECARPLLRTELARAQRHTDEHIVDKHRILREYEIKPSSFAPTSPPPSNERGRREPRST